MTTPQDVVKAYLFKRGYVENRGIGISRLARDMKVTKAYMSGYLAGTRNLSISTMHVMCQVLDIDFGKFWLLDQVVRGTQPKERFGEAMEHFECDLNGLLDLAKTLDKHRSE